MSGKAVVFGALSAVAVAAILTATKPRIAYDAEGRPLCFGLDGDQTVLPVWLAAAGGGMLVYAAYTMSAGK